MQEPSQSSTQDNNSFSCVYKISCIGSDKFYIGSAKNFKTRVLTHKNKLKRHLHPNKILQNLWNKHGEDSFQFTVIENCSLEDLLRREQYYLDQYYDNQVLCINILPKAGSVIGRKHSLETRKKMSDSHKGKKKSKEHVQKIINNRRQSPSVLFQEGKNNPMFGKCGSNHHFYGRKHSPESIEKMKAAKKHKQLNKHSQKPIQQYDKNNNLIASYNSIKEAIEITNIKSIKDALKGRYKTAGGFIWKYC